MRHLEYCQIRDMTPEEKMAFLTRNILFDSRLGMKECMVSSKMLGLSYDSTIQKLIEINMEMPDSLQVVRMKNMSEIQYCHAFNNGDCKFGESCRYVHKINPNHYFLIYYMYLVYNYFSPLSLHDLGSFCEYIGMIHQIYNLHC